MGIGVRNSLFRGSTACQRYCDTIAPSDARGRAGELPHIALHGFQSWRRSISYAYLLPCPIKLPSLNQEQPAFRTIVSCVGLLDMLPSEHHSAESQTPFVSLARVRYVCYWVVLAKDSRLLAELSPQSRKALVLACSVLLMRVHWRQA